MKLAPIILFFAFVGTVLMADIPIRNRRGLPGVPLKEQNPTTFKQQYFHPRPYWGGSQGNYNYGVNSYGVGTYGGYGSSYGSKFGYNGAATYGVGSYSAGSNSGLGGGAYGK